MFGFYVGITIAVVVGVIIGGLILRGIEDILDNNFFGF